MRVVLIDDELLILEHFERFLTKIDGIEVIGKYTNPYEAIEAIEQEPADIVFLDIEMPEINGLELAEMIQSKWFHIKIVFVTAHSEYAVKAFELNAVDYLLKPVQMDRLIKTINRLQKDDRSVTSEIYDQVCYFRSLHFKRSEVINVRWRTSKAKELFAYLLQNDTKPVSKSVLLDLFWPDTEWEKGTAHLYTTIYQIRKLLREINFNIKIISLDNSYVLDLNGVKLDVKEWEKAVARLPAISKETLSEHMQTLELYKGNYLEEEGYLWAESERERLKTLWLSHASKITDFLVSIEKITDAIGIYHSMQEFYPYVEEYYFMLMKLYDQLGDRDSVERQYKSLETMCEIEYETQPSKMIQSWFQRWKK